LYCTDIFSGKGNRQLHPGEIIPETPKDAGRDSTSSKEQSSNSKLK